MLYFNLHSKVHPGYRIVLQVQHTSQTLQPEPSLEVPRTPKQKEYFVFIIIIEQKYWQSKLKTPVYLK